MASGLRTTPRRADKDLAPHEGLIQRAHRKIGRKCAEPRNRAGNLNKVMPGKRPRRQRVSPVIAVAGDQRRQMGRFAKQRVFEQVSRLPVPFPFGQAQVPMHHAKGSLGRIDHRDLCAPRLAAAMTQRNLMLGDKRPTREQQIAVAAVLQSDVQLLHVGNGPKMIQQQLVLVVIVRASHIPIDLLQADNVRIFIFNNRDDPLEAVPTIATTDSLMNVVTQQTHRRAVVPPPSARPSARSK